MQSPEIIARNWLEWSQALDANPDLPLPPFRPNLQAIASMHPQCALETFFRLAEQYDSNAPDGKFDAQARRFLDLLGAGGLETLLVDHGIAVISEIESFARFSPAFRHMLSKVWHEDIDSDVSLRVAAIVESGV